MSSGTVRTTKPAASVAPRRNVNMALPLIELNVGGWRYTSTLSTMSKQKDNSWFCAWFATNCDETNKADQPEPDVAEQQTAVSIAGDGAVFIDRDGCLFRFVLDYLRTGRVLLPDNFKETHRLIEESKFYDLQSMTKQLINSQKKKHSAIMDGSPNDGGHIIIGYRGSFAFGRDGQADVKFRKVNRILVNGKAALCRDVFGETLNESRDPDREGSERYTARLYLKHQSLEKAFDCLTVNGFNMVTAVSSGANGIAQCGHVGGGSSSNMPNAPASHSSPDARGSVDLEEQRWARYTEFVFWRAAQAEQYE